MSPPRTAPEGQREDRELMTAIAGRDPDALGELYDRYAPTVFALCLRVLSNPAEAEEVLGDVFFEVWERGERYDAARAAPLAYLLTLGRSRAIDRLRALGRRSRVWTEVLDLERAGELCRDPASDGLGFAELALAERRARVVQALAILSTAERTAVELSFFHGLTHREIAELLDAPLGTIKTRIRRGLLRLRDELTRDRGAPS